MEFQDLASKRRSIRSYTDREVPGELISQLLDAAHWAPSGGNCQPWHFYVIKNTEILAQLRDRVFTAGWFRQVGTVIVVCAIPEESGARYGERGASLYCLQDTAAAVQNILLCAENLGLGACWCGAFDEEACAEVLRLPDGRRPVALIPLGYPASDPPARPRRPLLEITTWL